MQTQEQTTKGHPGIQRVTIWYFDASGKPQTKRDDSITLSESLRVIRACGGRVHRLITED